MKKYPDQEFLERRHIAFPRGYGDLWITIEEGKRASVCHACDTIVPPGQRVAIQVRRRQILYQRGGSSWNQKYFIHVDCLSNFCKADNKAIQERDATFQQMNGDKCWSCRHDLENTDFVMDLPPPYHKGYLCFACSMKSCYRLCTTCGLYHLRKKTSPKVDDAISVVCDDCSTYYYEDEGTVRQYRRKKKREERKLAEEQELLDEFDKLAAQAEEGTMFDA